MQLSVPARDISARQLAQEHIVVVIPVPPKGAPVSRSAAIAPHNRECHHGSRNQQISFLQIEDAPKEIHGLSRGGPLLRLLTPMRAMRFTRPGFGRGVIAQGTRYTRVLIRMGWWCDNPA